MKLVCISDTHGEHDSVKLPEGDVLIHAGDMCNSGHIVELSDFAEWLVAQPHKHKIVIAGNHDWCFKVEAVAARRVIAMAGGVYLQDESLVIDDVKFYGSPWQPEFCNWAFNLPRGPALAEKWAMIPEDTDVLITHGPAWGMRDTVGGGEPLGCNDLFLRTGALPKLKAHIFGHIHDSAGLYIDDHDRYWANASICNEAYEPVNKPIVIEVASEAKQEDSKGDRQ